MNELFRCQYDPEKFHCVHFVLKAAQVLLQKDYSFAFMGLAQSLDQAIHVSKSNVIQHKRLQKPIHGCIVLMTYFNESSHVGLFFRNRILHLTENGVQNITLEQAKPLFKRMRFYEPNLHH